MRNVKLKKCYDTNQRPRFIYKWRVQEKCFMDNITNIFGGGGCQVYPIHQ